MNVTFTSRYLKKALNSIHKQAVQLNWNDYKLLLDRILEESKQKN